MYRYDREWKGLVISEGEFTYFNMKKYRKVTMADDYRSGRDIEEFLDCMKQFIVHNVKGYLLEKEMNRVLIALKKDIFAVIFNVLEVSSLLDSNSELNLFALQLIYFEPRINASLEEFTEPFLKPAEGFSVFHTGDEDGIH